MPKPVEKSCTSAPVPCGCPFFRPWQLSVRVNGGAFGKTQGTRAENAQLLSLSYLAKFRNKSISNPLPSIDILTRRSSAVDRNDCSIQSLPPVADRRLSEKHGKPPGVMVTDCYLTAVLLHSIVIVLRLAITAKIVILQPIEISRIHVRCPF